MKTKDKISGYIIRSGAWAVFLWVAFIAASSAVNSQNRWDESQKAHQAGAQVRMNHVPLAPSDTVHEAWVARYNGPGNSFDAATAMAVDSSGNVYVTGASSGSGTDFDYATIKYNAAGQQQWVARYNGPGNSFDAATAMAVDAVGNVYVTGSSIGSDIYGDYATIKYNAAGQQQWVARYNGPGNETDYGMAIAVDVSGNVYVTGSSFGGSGNQTDYATIKYNSAGQQQWVVRYDSHQPGHSGDDVARAMAVDPLGNIYVTGACCGPPYNYGTVKYNSAGQQQWVARYYDANGDASAIAVDSLGYIYVTGTSATIKYNAAGQQEWVAPAQGNAMAIDGAGNVLVTGSTATIKYNSAGQQQWIIYSRGEHIAVDNSDNVYVTKFRFFDYVTTKYFSARQQARVEAWVARYNGPGNGSDHSAAIAVDALGNVYVTGQSVGSGTETDYATIKYVQTPTNDDFADAIVISTTSGSLVGTNKGSTTEVGEPAGENSVWYRWTAPNNGEAHFRIGMDWLTIDVYTGTAINALTRIATSSGSPSAVNWTAVAGTTYRIRLTKNTHTSAFALVWSL